MFTLNPLPTRNRCTLNGWTAITRVLRLDLKLIADVWLVGFPNVGINIDLYGFQCSSRIANYDLRHWPRNSDRSISVSLIRISCGYPGIIGGASEGKGLGLNSFAISNVPKPFVHDWFGHRIMSLSIITKPSNKSLEKFSPLLAERKLCDCSYPADAMSLKRQSKNECVFETCHLDPVKKADLLSVKSIRCMSKPILTKRFMNAPTGIYCSISSAINLNIKH